MTRVPLAQSPTASARDHGAFTEETGAQCLTSDRLNAEFGNKAAGFDSPTQLPLDDAQRSNWQHANRSWWETSPMRYDWRSAIGFEPGTAEYFAEIDRRFLSAVQRFLPWREVPFDGLIDYDRLRAQDVLEIGVGHGTNAQFLAERAKAFVGIDLTSQASIMSARRLRIMNLPGSIVQMDAEYLGFADNSFDFIWSWGVIHHSADTRAVLREMHRVLRPGGTCTVMVYYRSWWSYYMLAFAKCLLMVQWPTRSTLVHVRQKFTDGAIARYYTCAEWKAVAGEFFDCQLSVHGMSIELIPLPHGTLKTLVHRLVPDRVARFFTHRFAMGSFLIARMTRS